MHVTKFVKNDTEKWETKECKGGGQKANTVKTSHGTLNSVFIFINGS